jgi:hypothetical protein
MTPQEEEFINLMFLLVVMMVSHFAVTLSQDTVAPSQDAVTLSQDTVAPSQDAVFAIPTIKVDDHLTLDSVFLALYIQ